MGILDRISKIVKAEVNHQLRKSGIFGEGDILSSDLEAELKRLEEELRQAEEAERRRQRGAGDYYRSDDQQRQHRGKGATTPTVYEVLGVSPRAPQKEIKKKYRQLAKKYHPDRIQQLSPSLQAIAKKNMAEINQAYDQIENPTKRQEYDRKINLY
ncbi:DnaJ domain-containing protein [candidate division CSSED10-310 bacterium]|uniref:DnaJ domain-containing protein n=1 Tax=candidate division CSSED10-310 bacterium TaxID=2855610 RepID=A0ABV6Z650_UNCC1